MLPEYDQFGMLVHASLDQEDPWKTRVAQAEALRNMAHLWGPAEVVTLFEMLIDGGALGDRVEAVRTRMLEVIGRSSHRLKSRFLIHIILGGHPRN